MSRSAYRMSGAGLVGFLALLAAVLLLPGGLSPAVGSERMPDSSRAGVSIVHGKAARIASWPWQVAIALKDRPGKRKKPSKRVYCGGAVIAPRLVVSAGHCVSFLRSPRQNRIEVISGRTWLNQRQAGQTVNVRRVLLPRSASGKLLYREQNGTASWDVSLLELRQPLSATPILLAGPRESRTWTPGHPVWVTGWGVTSSRDQQASPGLRAARQVMLNDRVCRTSQGPNFVARLMNCAGGPGGSASSCIGDSGGPLVAPVTGPAGREYRLVGLTSFGDSYCRGNQPSVFTGVGSDPIRGWIAAHARRLAQEDVVGQRGRSLPVPAWCRVPHVIGLNPKQARRKLRRNRCSLGSVMRDRTVGSRPGKRRKIFASSRYPGWLAPPGFRLRVWVPG